jgi:hypothetical protein
MKEESVIMNLNKFQKTVIAFDRLFKTARYKQFKYWIRVGLTPTSAYKTTYK